MRSYQRFLSAPVTVRRRYFAIQSVGYFLPAVRAYMRIVLTIKEKRKRQLLDETIETCRNSIETANVKGNKCTQMLMNMGLYYLIAEKDIQTVKIDALTHPNEWKRLLSLRIILLTIHELDMGKVNKGDLKDLLTKSSVDKNLQRELFQSLRVLRKSQERAAKLLHFERNATIAHRDPDALLQLNTIQNLNKKRVFAIAADFYKAADAYMKILPRVVERAGSLEGLVSFLLNNRKA